MTILKSHLLAPYRVSQREKSIPFISTLLLALCVALPLSLHAQSARSPVASARADSCSPTEHYFGVDGAAVLALHSSGFSELPGVPSCCPYYTSATGIGYSAGIQYERSVSLKSLPLIGTGLQKWLVEPTIALRLNYVSFPAPFRQSEVTTVLLDGVLHPGEFTHVLDATINRLNAEILLGRNKVWKGMSMQAGLTLGYTLSTSFRQSEQLTQPEDRGVFSDNLKRVRNEFSGAIPQANTLALGLMAALGWQLPLSSDGNLLARPTLSFVFPLNANVQGIDWKTFQLRAGLTLLYHLSEDVDIEPESPPAPALLALREAETAPFRIQPQMLQPSPPPNKYLDLRVVRKDEANHMLPVDTIVIRGAIETNVRPLLNYIFFDEDSSSLAPRYLQLQATQTADYSEKNFHHLGMIETYRQLLNILALRMKRNPAANVMLTGCTMNRGSETERIDLARKRSESVKDYLVKVWNIAPSRIFISTRSLPAKPSFVGNPDGDAENRRVEITSLTPSLLAPVSSADTVYTAQPSSVYLRPNIAFDDMQDWNMNAMRDDSLLQSFTGTATPPDEQSYTIAPAFSPTKKTGSYLRFGLNATDSEGNNYSAKEQRIPLRYLHTRSSGEKDTAGKVIENYSLILFDFDDATLTPLHERTIEALRQSLTPESEVTISGYTDRMGEDDYNKKLAEKRARAVARLLPSTKSLNILPVGESTMLYDNSTPEGRFYCRTIDVRVEKTRR